MNRLEHAENRGLGQRSAGLDLLRAAAILMVLLSHCSDMFAGFFGASAPAALSASGFLGVELFFVLSGFLIGRLLFEILADGVSFRAWRVFMLRRWMRTLPLYYTVLFLLAWLWAPRFWEPGTAALWHDLPWYAGLVQNLAWPMMDGWFGVSWSLTIEEWFYLLFSLCLMGFAAHTDGRYSPWWVIGLFLTIPLIVRLAVGHWTGGPITVSKIALLRLDSIAYGVALALLERQSSRLFQYPRLAAAIGLVLLGLAWRETISDWHLIAPAAFLPLFPPLLSVGFALWFPLALCLPHGHGIAIWMVRRLSTLSYSLYLTHLTILEMFGYMVQLHRISPPSAVVGSLGTILCVSWLTWRVIEQPFMALRPAQNAIRPLHAKNVTEPV